MKLAGACLSSLWTASAMDPAGGGWPMSRAILPKSGGHVGDTGASVAAPRWRGCTGRRGVASPAVVGRTSSAHGQSSKYIAAASSSVRMTRRELTVSAIPRITSGQPGARLVVLCPPTDQQGAAKDCQRVPPPPVEPQIGAKGRHRKPEKNSTTHATSHLRPETISQFHP